MSARSPAFHAAVTHALAGLPPGRVESAATYDAADDDAAARPRSLSAAS
jgi:hypothetical protein